MIACAGETRKAHDRLQPESMQVLRDMMAPVDPPRVKTPVVVIGADHDWLVAPPRELAATARAFHTDPITMPGGHDMMLDVAWEQVGLEIVRSIRTHTSRLEMRTVERVQSEPGLPGGLG